MRWSVKMVPLVVVLAGAVCGAVWWWFDGDGREADNVVRLFGHVEMRDVRLAFSEQERVAAVLVEEGERVAAGQVVARLHAERLQARVRESEARIAAQQAVLDRLLAGARHQEVAQVRSELAAAEVRATNARMTVARLRQTTAAGASSVQALDDAAARLQEAKAQREVRRKALELVLEGPRREEIEEAESRLSAERAALDLLRIRLADMALYAPAAGVVRSRILEPGEMADPGRPVVVLALTGTKWVRAWLPGPDLGRVDSGMAARVNNDTFPEQPLSGWVGFISPKAEFTPKNVETTDLRTQLVYEVRIHVNDPEDVLRQGMPVSVRVDPAAASGVPSPARSQARR
ncbi:HlyD family efflux transporter periplasmic adaptor subunit [Desulfatitalea alkaliphila]|uniref:HlyD family efflux transporter periplasmic adaptor subunit n=1 Tax=Desulfatitalea alkaliphila TaxID=2929485 RepID=A0AA41UJ79_9BACT|nr:HlyD family efflux transporter periplasmic adaptor subunit [Desulfatitalea alkaliphila]MCJ8500277.1 HlyD family efflux transporter periplasmic adaptor subunit [Desulfatitalea alkaliphila]